MPYLCQWADANALAGLDPELRNEMEMTWFLTKAEFIALVNKYLALRAQDNPDFPYADYDELSEEQQAAMAAGLARLFAAQMQAAPGESLLTICWDQLDFD